jgi:hypothetical protein
MVTPPMVVVVQKRLLFEIFVSLYVAMQHQILHPLNYQHRMKKISVFLSMCSVMIDWLE